LLDRIGVGVWTSALAIASVRSENAAFPDLARSDHYGAPEAQEGAVRSL